MSGELKGYKVLSKQHTAKSIMYFVRRWGKKYVVKEYTDYRFREHRHGEAVSDALKRAEQRTEVYYKHLQKTARLMRRSMRQDGLMNIPLDVFRRGLSMYKVSRQIDACGLTFEQLHERLNGGQLNVFLRTLLVQLEQLEKIGFIHCDLKPENIIICRSRAGAYSAAIIDCDSGIIIGDDDTHYVDYTPEYAAPELHEYKNREAEEDEDADEYRSRLSCAADMFSAACLIVHCLTGEPLGGDEKIPAAMMDAGRIVWVPKIHPVWRMMVRRTLHPQADKRLNAGRFLEMLAKAEDVGLMSELQMPFDGLGEGEFIECGKRQVMLQRRGEQIEALWYMDELWNADTGRQSTHILSGHDAEIRKKRDELQRICGKINTLCDAGGLLYPMQVKTVGHRCFIEQRLPVGKLSRPQYMKERLSTEKADEIMSAVLQTVDRIQKSGFNCCLMDIDDIWLIKQANGRIMPILSGLHKLIPSEEMPMPEQLDVYPQIAAPEVCAYLGTTDDEIRSALREVIDGRSTLFNLGIVYHVLLCGRMPRMTNSGEMLFGEAVWHETEDMSALMIDGSIDGRRRALIERMLDCDSENRPQDCQAVIKMLSSFWNEADEPQTDTDTDDWGEGWEDVPAEKNEPQNEADGNGWEDVPAGYADDELYDDEPSDEDGWIETDLNDALWADALQAEDALSGEWTDAAGDAVIYSQEDVERAENEEVPQELLEQLSGLLACFAKRREKDEAEAEAMADGAYTVGAEDAAGWCEMRHDASGQKVLGHTSERQAFDDAAQARRVQRIVQEVRQIAEKCENVMPVEEICRVDGKLRSVVKSEQSRIWCMANESMRSAVDGRLIDEWMKLIVGGVQAAHERGLLCGAVTAENTAVPGDTLQINIAEHAVFANNAEDMTQWRQWMQPWRIGGQRRSKRQAGAYLSPEAERFLAGEDVQLAKTSDIFSLGVLYHVFWCGELPYAEESEGGWSGKNIKVSSKIPFAQRALIELMLSAEPGYRPQSCQKVIAVIEEIQLKRGKTHSVTVKRDGLPIAGKKAWLYMLDGDSKRYVASAMTDRQGKAVFTGYLPEAKYYVKCDGEKVFCRWRSF